MVTKLRLVKAIVRNDDKYLLLKKAKDEFFPENIDKWECSGGLIKNGQTPKDRVIEKLKAETGLEYKTIKKLPTLRMTDREYDSKCDVYLIDVHSNRVNLSKEHSDYRWIKAEDVKNMNLVLYANLLLEFFNNPKKYF